MDMKKWKKYLKRISYFIILLVLSTILVQCELLIGNLTIKPEIPPFFEMGDTLVFKSRLNIDSFYIDEAKLYGWGETFDGEDPKTEADMTERFASSTVQLNCNDSCYKFTSYISPSEYWFVVYGLERSSKKIWAGIGGNSYSIGKFDFNDLYKIKTEADKVSGKEIRTVYYSKKYGVVEYELTNGEVFDLDESCITMMEERHKKEK